MKVKGHIPIRTCISCGKKRPKGFLIRLVADYENRIIKDISAVIQGRGAYICDAQPCLERLVHNKRLGKYFGKTIAATLEELDVENQGL